MDEYGLDMDEVNKVIDTAEVLLVRFAILNKRMLMDTRANEVEGPFIGAVPRAGSAEERFRSLKQLRPRFPLPDKIMSFMWPRPSLESFRASGLWKRITDRLVLLGGDEMATRCEKIYRELEGEERQEVLAAIRGGETYQSLWERSK